MPAKKVKAYKKAIAKVLKQSTPEQAAPAKHPGGRPTKYDPALIPAMLKEFAKGASKNEVAVFTLGISKDTFYQWVKKNKEFSDSVKLGEALSEAWWMRSGRQNLENKDFSATLWYMNMKNRHGWRDKQETKIEGSLKVRWEK